MVAFDQVEAFAFWLGLRLPYSLRFVLGFRKDYQLLDAAGNRGLTWKIAASATAAGRNALEWDARLLDFVIAAVLVLAVAHPGPS